MNDIDFSISFHIPLIAIVIAAIIAIFVLTFFGAVDSFLKSIDLGQIVRFFL